MQIESGKYYATRDGRKVGPMMENGLRNYPWCSQSFEGDNGDFWDDDGYSDEECENNLITEWNDDTETIDASSMAILAAQHRIKITVQVGDALIEYDGRS